MMTPSERSLSDMVKLMKQHIDVLEKHNKLLKEQNEVLKDLIEKREPVKACYTCRFTQYELPIALRSEHCSKCHEHNEWTPKDKNYVEGENNG